MQFRRISIGFAFMLCFVLMLTAKAYAYGPADLQIPSEAEAIVYGSSGEGRSLTAYRFGSGNNVMVLGFAIHGFEDGWKRDGEALVYTAGRLMALLHENQALIRDYGWSVYVLPCMNPDGLLSGYTSNGPGRCTTRYYNAAGALVSGGLDLNRSFPYRWARQSSSRNYNGSSPLAAKEAQALAAFIRSVKGSGQNVLIDVHGWEKSILGVEGSNTLIQTLSTAFPGNKLMVNSAGAGYFFSYAYSVGYHACLFEFPGGVGSLDSFKSSGMCERFNNCIPQLLKSYGNYAPRATVKLQTDGPGSVSGAGEYLQGSRVSVSAKPMSGAYFRGWFDGDRRLSRDLNYQFTLDRDCTLTARFSWQVTVSVKTSRSGTVSGAGAYSLGQQVTLKAKADRAGLGAQWYLGDDCVASGDSYSFSILEDTQLTLLFEGDVFADIPGNAWYLDDAMEAYSRGLIQGVSSIRFDPGGPCTRAMAAVLLFRLVGAETIGWVYPSFSDVPANKYYTTAVAWAQENGIVNGTSQTTFSPGAEVTREQFVTMLVRFLQWKGYVEEPAMLEYTDCSEISPYALMPLSLAQSMGLIRGYQDGRLQPKSKLTRSEATALLMRAVRYMDSFR